MFTALNAMKFAVVEFTKDRSVEVVPSNWIVGNACYWPPYRGMRFTTSVKKSETPDETWNEYQIRVIDFYGMPMFLT